MTRRDHWMLAAVAAALCLVLGMGCGPTDPNDPMYWVAKFRTRDRKEAIKKLASMGEKAHVAVPDLIKLYRKGKEKGEIIATLAQINAKGPEVEAVFATAISDATEQDAAAAAAEALGDLKATGKLKELVAVLDMDMEDQVKAAALRALITFRSPASVDDLIRILERDPDKQWIHLNALACTALGDIGLPAAEKALPAVVLGLFLRDRFSRLSFRECSIAMIKLGDPAARAMIAAMDGQNEKLEAMAKKKGFVDGLIQEEGVKVLSLLGYQGATPRILKELVVKTVPPPGYTEEKRTIWAAIEAQRFQNSVEALGRLGVVETVGELAKWLDQGEYLRRVRVPWALNMIGGEEAYKALFQCSKKAKVDGNTWLRLDCAQHMAYLARPEQVADLEAAEVVVAKMEAELKAYRSSDPSGANDFLSKLEGLRLNIVALKECGTTRDCWEKRLTHKHPHVREKAVWELSRMTSDPKALDILLANVATEDFEYRNAILQVLPRACDERCVAPLRKLIEAEKGKTAVKGFRDVMQFVLARVERKKQ